MNGRLEAQIALEGDTLTIDDGGGADVIPLDFSGYWTDFLAYLETEIESGVGSGFTLSASFGQWGTGQITIAKNSGTFKLLFPSDALANLFGVAAAADWNGTPATSYTSARGVQGVWLPHCGMIGAGLDYGIQGHLRSDAQYTMGPTGSVSVFVSSSSYRSQRSVRWVHVDRDRAVDGANAAVVSWQQFVRESQWGGVAYFPITGAGFAPPVRIYVDADASTLLGAAAGGDGEYSLVLKPDLELVQVTEGWTGLWTVEVQEVVKM